MTLHTPSSMNSSPHPTLATIPGAARPRGRTPGVVLIAVLLSGLALQASQPLNGAPRRPFYIFGHNPNTVQLVHDDLNRGANALEPDVSVLASDICSGDPTDSRNLVTCDTDVPGCVCSGVTYLLDWLKDLHSNVLAAQRGDVGSNPAYAGLALVVFDCKTPADVDGNGTNILNAVRTYLNDGLPTPLNIVLSAPDIASGRRLFSAFNQASPDPHAVLRSNEALMIDGEPNVDDVVTYFRSSLGFTGNVAYGAGSSAGPGALYAPSLPRRIDRAVWHRAAYNDLQLIPYAYLIPADDMDYYIDAGVDGIICKEEDLPTLLLKVLARTDVVIATPAMNPFTAGPPAAYALEVTTGTGVGAGTDATLSFSLSSSSSSAVARVDTSAHVATGYDIPASRMESGHTDCVTIPSGDLGPVLSSLAVFNDGSGLGSDWQFASVTIRSARWFGACGRIYTASPGQSVAPRGTGTFPLTESAGRLEEWVSVNAPAIGAGGGQFNPWPPGLAYLAYLAACPGGTVFFSSGNYAGFGRLDKPGRFVRGVGSPFGLYPEPGVARLTP